MVWFGSSSGVALCICIEKRARSCSGCDTVGWIVIAYVVSFLAMLSCLAVGIPILRRVNQRTQTASVTVVESEESDLFFQCDSAIATRIELSW